MPTFGNKTFCFTVYHDLSVHIIKIQLVLVDVFFFSSLLCVICIPVYVLIMMACFILSLFGKFF